MSGDDPTTQRGIAVTKDKSNPFGFKFTGTPSLRDKQQQLLAQQEQEREIKLDALRRQQLLGLRTRFGGGFGSAGGTLALGDLVASARKSLGRNAKLGG
jgi:hypothetical protein